MSLGLDPIEKFQFIHHFVPHPNRKRATLISTGALMVYTFLLIIFLAVFKLVPVAMPGVLGYASNIVIEDLYSETNRVRVEHGLQPLVLNPELSKAAQLKAGDMFKYNYWAHISPSGTRPWDFFDDVAYDYTYAGENLAKNFNTSSEVVVAWYNSSSHRENLLNQNYTEIGFAVVDGVLQGYETTLVVQLFGKPRTPSYTAGTLPSSFNNTTRGQLAQAEPVTEVPVVAPSEPVVHENVVAKINLTNVSRYILATFGMFVLALLLADIWYSRKRGETKFTGHTFAHVIFLVSILGAVLLTISPGKIL